jgi:polyisoprenoid-binding protein YceI
MRNAACLLLSLSLMRAQAADMYSLDPVNTRIAFNVQYFGRPWVSARFSGLSGAFVLDRHGPASRVDVSVQTASVDCRDSYWNGRLRSGDWLDVQRFPQMTFHSEQVQFLGGDRALASGQLSLHGVTRPVELEISQLSCQAAGDAGDAGDTCHFVAHARLKRSDYGFAHGLWSGGNEVDIAISGVGVRREAPPSADLAPSPQPSSATDSLTRPR